MSFADVSVFLACAVRVLSLRPLEGSFSGQTTLGACCAAWELENMLVFSYTCGISYPSLVDFTAAIAFAFGFEFMSEAEETPGI